MRPSDVPTYVEHGAADLGITGKDVLLEQSEREVYELLDLGFGRCRMVVAAREGEDALGESLRRLGRVRIATKYPRIAADQFAHTGRQAEIVEVKGSVELAPLTGLADGIVDLTATGRTLAENGLRDRRGDRACTARLIANPVAHKLKAARSTRWSRGVRREDRRAAGSGRPAGARARSRGRRARDPRRGAQRTATPRCVRLTERFDHAELGPERAARWTRARSRRRSGVLEPAVLRGPADWRWPTCARWPRRSCASRWRSTCRRASAWRSPSCRCAGRGVYVPGGRAAVSVDRGHVRGDRARGRRRGGGGVRAARARTGAPTR